MTDEEKKAIEYLKRNNIVEIQYDDYGLESIHRIGIDEKQTILNLIEKQQKEIEELKRQDLSNSKIIANMSERHFHDREKIRKYEALQDKIKAKIEELQKEKIEMTVDIINHNTLAEIIRDEQINILQLLLEKE